MKLCTELPSSEDHGKRIILLFYNFADLHKWWVDAEYDKAETNNGKKISGVQGCPQSNELGKLERKKGKDGSKIHKTIFKTENIFKIVPSKHKQSSYEKKEPWKVCGKLL